MDAAYVFTVTFELDPTTAADGGGAPRLDPDRFETTVEVPAAAPGTSGWLLFRDRLWRGEVGDEASMRRFLGERLGVEVVAVSFRELRTDEAYRDALRTAIAEDLTAFNAANVDEVVHKYLGSSVHVRD
ncbi:MAG: LWR-salt protein [Halorubrum sp.]